VKIVILDARTTNPGDVSWGPLEAMGELVVYEETPKEALLQHADGAEVLITNKTPINADVIKAAKALRCICTLSTGYNIVDIETAARRGIPVCNVPSYCTRAVAQMTFALLLELTNRVQHHSDSVHAGKWAAGRDFCYWEHPLVELENKYFGVLGFGHTGRAAAEVALALGMRVLVYSRTESPMPQGCRFVSFEELLQKCDVLSLHCPLTEETRGIIDEEALSKMKPGAFLINTARGPVLCEQAVAQALNSGRLGGAAVDVLSTEPPRPDNPLLGAQNCIITPHIAWAAEESRLRLIRAVADNVAAFLQGAPQNVVNPEYETNQ
jgi:glycerate dehydrogenase